MCLKSVLRERGGPRASSNLTLLRAASLSLTFLPSLWFCFPLAFQSLQVVAFCVFLNLLVIFHGREGCSALTPS